MERRRTAGMKLPGKMNEAEQYLRWRKVHDPTQHRLDGMRQESHGWELRPKVSIIMATYNTPIQYLREAVESVRAQAYDNWELCIVDDHSSDPRVKDEINQFTVQDARIKAKFRSENGRIGAASNDALGLATGEWVTWLDHDDLLPAEALYELVNYVREKVDTDMVYSDEDLLSAKGLRCNPFFKPDWSPELLLGWNYVTHLTLMRTALVREVGGYREEFTSSADHDLLLRVSEKARHVGHVAKILYHWRQAAGSTSAAGNTAKPKAAVEGRRAVTDALARRGLVGRVEFSDVYPYQYPVKYQLDEHPLVDILIPTKDRIDLLLPFIRSIEELTTYPNYRITIVDNQSSEPETLSYLESTTHNVIKFDQPFHHARIIHAGVDATQGEIIFIANNDMLVVTPDWLENMVCYAVRPDVGMVGCWLKYPNGTTQHGGVAVGRMYKYAMHVAPAIGVAREVSAVTGAAQLLRRSVWEELGGFNDVQVAYGDIDFCLRVREAGYRIIYTPLAELVHFESATRGYEWDPPEEKREFIKRWGDVVEPYMAHHLLGNKDTDLNVDGNGIARVADEQLERQAVGAKG
jgi:GT2 family glycosyltransferase